ncbi:MAG TPA: hydrogenase iron-sulfur subunit [Candidatus Bathyarchaeia archaeon]|nr:hydrogenase iron-sulfur subunit [Candidatus Bathyarchaeia archaeon]
MEPQDPGIILYVCRQCLADRTPLPHECGSLPRERGSLPRECGSLPRQWEHLGVHVQVKELPCSGKIDPEYLFGALEAGARGLLVVTCPKGECRLGQGNYRAEIRVGTVQRLLAEIGVEPERVVLTHCAPADDVRAIVDSAVDGFCALGESPIRVRTVKAG